ncbi:hypothetical protein AB9F42_34105, partial [Rhizobium leguminosarum]
RREQIVLEQKDPQHEDASYFLREYYGELALRFEKGFDVSLSRDPDAKDMIRPRGAFLVAARGWGDPEPFDLRDLADIALQPDTADRQAIRHGHQ